jgi:hypothetical protein
MEQGSQGREGEHAATLVGIGKSLVYYAIELIEAAETDEAAREWVAKIDAGEAERRQIALKGQRTDVAAIAATSGEGKTVDAGTRSSQGSTIAWRSRPGQGEAFYGVQCHTYTCGNSGMVTTP